MKKNFLLIIFLLLLLVGCSKKMAQPEYGELFKKNGSGFVSYYSHKKNFTTDMSPAGIFQYEKDKKTGKIKNIRRTIGSEGFINISDNYIIDAKYDLYYDGMKINDFDTYNFDYLGCDYFTDNNSVYYKTIKIDGADAKSFSALNYGYAKDGKNVYYMGKVVKSADPATFSGYDYGYSHDKKSAFYKTEIIDGLSPKGLAEYLPILESEYLKNEDIILNEDYRKTKDGVKYKGTVIIDADVHSFYVLEDYENKYGADKNSIYYQGIKLSEGDPATFKILGRDFTLDKDNVYYKNVKNNDIDRKSFEYFDFGFFKTKDGVFSDNEIIKNIDSATFESLNNIFYKDKNSIYYHKEKLENADYKTFEAFKYGYAKDKNNVYFFENIINGADAATFVVLKDGYAKDSKTVYKYGLPANTISLIRENGGDQYTFEVLKDKQPADMRPEKGALDPATVEVFKNGYVKDKNGIYYFVPGFGNTQILGILVKSEADPATFEILGDSEYSKDKNSVYFWGFKLGNANSSTSVLKDDFIVDGNKIYLWGMEVKTNELKREDYDKYKEVYYNAMYNRTN